MDTLGSDGMDHWRREGVLEVTNELGTFDLRKGQNELTAEIVGRNEAATNYCFGIDYLLLK